MIKLSIKTDFSGLEKVKKFPTKMKLQIDRKIQDIAYILRDETARTIDTGRRSGRTYRTFIAGKIRTHQASADGEPAARETGKLSESLRVDKIEFGAEVGTDVLYSVFLENPNGLNRQFFEPTINRMESTFNRLIQDALNESIK